MLIRNAKLITLTAVFLTVLGASLSAALPRAAFGATATAETLGDLSPFRTITADTLKMVKAGNLPAATTRIKDLETSWDEAARRLRARNPDGWKTVDKAIDRALSELRAGKPNAATSAEALQNLLKVVDASK